MKDSFLWGLFFIQISVLFIVISESSAFGPRETPDAKPYWLWNPGKNKLMKPVDLSMDKSPVHAIGVTEKFSVANIWLMVPSTHRLENAAIQHSFLDSKNSVLRLIKQSRFFQTKKLTETQQWKFDIKGKLQSFDGKRYIFLRPPCHNETNDVDSNSISGSLSIMYDEPDDHQSIYGFTPILPPYSFQITDTNTQLTLTTINSGRGGNIRLIAAPRLESVQTNQTYLYDDHTQQTILMWNGTKPLALCVKAVYFADIFRYFGSKSDKVDEKYQKLVKLIQGLVNKIPRLILEKISNVLTELDKSDLFVSQIRSFINGESASLSEVAERLLHMLSSLTSIALDHIKDLNPAVALAIRALIDFLKSLLKYIKSLMDRTTLTVSVCQPNRDFSERFTMKDGKIGMGNRVLTLRGADDGVVMAGYNENDGYNVTLSYSPRKMVYIANRVRNDDIEPKFLDLNNEGRIVEVTATNSLRWMTHDASSVSPSSDSSIHIRDYIDGGAYMINSSTNDKTCSLALSHVDTKAWTPIGNGTVVKQGACILELFENSSIETVL